LIDEGVSAEAQHPGKSAFRLLIEVQSVPGVFTHSFSQFLVVELL
jgi:hypothetical protein